MNLAATTSEPNRLAGEKSAYLQSAAHQPVAWHPWGDEAFAKARESDRPILLDIGAVWCHWCHVMDGESYENPETARIINEHFIAVKVDRDERPDIDRRYQEAVSAISGQGGWPLTAFLTPDGEVFFGGTYFPPVDSHGRRSFPTVLAMVADFFKNSRDSALSSARQLTAALRVQSDHADPGPLSMTIIDSGIRRAQSQFDPVHGGFGGAPKFPHPSIIELLLNRYFFSPDTNLEVAIKQTLTRMARGGVYDQIGGGFHRYSTDERWIVPHFEKMLYDNSELLRAYALGSAHFQDPEYAETARGIVRFMTEVLSDQEKGGFYTSQDADVGLHDDGDYFTWTLDEIKAACAPEEAAVLAERFHILEGGEMHHNPAKNVLFVATDIDVIAAKVNVLEAEASRRLESGMSKLRNQRARRTAPFVDKSIYTGWNGMAVSAFLTAADHLGLPEARSFALRTLNRILNECVLPDGRVLHAVGLQTPVGLLEDAVFVARACLDAYEATSDESYKSRARLIADDLIRRLWDDAAGGFFDHEPGPDAVGLLTQPRKPLQDAPTPSANAVAAEVFLRLFEMTDEQNYREIADKTLAAFAGAAPHLGVFGGSYYLSLDRFLRQSSYAVVAGPKGDPVSAGMWEAVGKSPRPYVIRCRLESDGKLPDALPPELKSMIGGKSPRAYFCAGNSCALPAESPEDYARTIASFAK